MYSNALPMKLEFHTTDNDASLYILSNNTDFAFTIIYMKNFLFLSTQVCRTVNEQNATLLDMLPSRGPSAFDLFCESLLECDHAHVADCLKTLEGKSPSLPIEVHTIIYIFKGKLSILNQWVYSFSSLKLDAFIEYQRKDVCALFPQ